VKNKMPDTIENMLKDSEYLRMLVRILVNSYGLDVQDKIIGFDKETKKEIVMDGRQVRLSTEEMYMATKNMALGLDYDAEKNEIILFTGYVESDNEGIRYDN
tara:strand:- start:1968 stop:2273 length:306 start_codon:yes stop_codon:yes gene_type:complete